MTSGSRRIVVAVDSFKGTIGARAAAEAIREGWLATRPGDEVRLRPMADGGEGTLETVAASLPEARRRLVAVRGPLDDTVEAPLLEFEQGGLRTALVELAAICGLERFAPGEPVPGLRTHTLGVGEMLAAALDGGVERLLVALGGSSSTDAGTGLLRALGARVLDEAGRPAPLGAAGLPRIARIELDGLRPLPSGGVATIADVDSPATGPKGAAHVFGPQKGLTPGEVLAADADIARIAGLLGVDPAEAGTGAAGAVGLGLRAWGAARGPGARTVAVISGLAEAMAGADLVITGEGSFDAQSERGKAPALVAELADAARVPVALVAGRIASEAQTDRFLAAVSLTELAGGGEAAMAEPARHLRDAGALLAAGWVAPAL
ncbi:glycerate kinase [Homoserinibacter sp. YIM 151385]|uniref:glycerate kinase n=1 Tax=Homoserinibacter sp. YIM 151385 TaxID=2985506 RepID=UPI0022F139C5|nr:glycerate kinase [Homoserinibacter sp. YIM 151385]WBU37524.1 glycerate kinase [Homoserinibacter sp. YIM 151385]